MIWKSLSSIKYWLYTIFCKYLYQSSSMKYLISVAWVELSVVTWGAIKLSVFWRVSKTLLLNKEDKNYKFKSNYWSLTVRKICNTKLWSLLSGYRVIKTEEKKEQGKRPLYVFLNIYGVKTDLKGDQLKKFLKATN